MARRASDLAIADCILLRHSTFIYIATSKIPLFSFPNNVIAQYRDLGVLLQRSQNTRGVKGPCGSSCSACDDSRGLSRIRKQLSWDDSVRDYAYEDNVSR